MAFPLTEEQREIVDDRGGELLVSAAAGSGKTRVLVERLLDRVTEEGLDIDQFLVITYTRAAAAELRGRIAQELADRLAEHPGDRHLRRQTTLVYRAQISTIHAFCAQLLRQNGCRAGIDPDFRLCDEGEGAARMAQVLSQLLDERYEDMDEEGDFAFLVDTMSAGRDDSRLEQIVLDIYGRIQSHPDPEGWLEEQKALWRLEGVTDVGQTPWGQLLMEDAMRTAEDCSGRLYRALELCELDEVVAANYAGSISETLDALAAFRRRLRLSWDEAWSALPIPFPVAGRKKGVKDAQTLERVKGLREGCKKQLTRLEELFDSDSAALLSELTTARRAVEALMDLVRDFGRAYQKEKGRLRVLDYSDLEHGAVALLVGSDGAPTELAEYCGASFAEIMVDEYQDTNQVQNAIFTAISQGGRKLFQVGDVKQSIYRFRLADPTIFLSKYQRFAPGGRAAEGQPRKRVLSRNFRSRREVLEGCNDLFRDIMTEELGELDYTEDQALVPGAQFPEEGDHRLELRLLDLSSVEGEGENKLPRELLEARHAARRIRFLLEEEGMVSEGGNTRPARPSDIMILMRSPGSALGYYVRALEEEGIPWTSTGGEDIFATTEVNVALSILQIVDNPRQDVALLAAMRSPVYGFTADELALLRAGSKGDFYSAVEAGAQRGDSHCAAFLKELEGLRFGAGDRTCRELIWHIYERTNMLGLFGAMEGGEVRQNNLLALYALAGQLEESGCRTLFSFLLRLERQRAAGKALAAPTPGGREGEGVTIMSIHRSKGLEKPVVVLGGLSRQFNREDTMRPVLFHQQLGVGPKGLDRERMVEYPTLARRAVARQLEREMFSEELRLLYVAMTRAREKLILVLGLTNGARALERLGEDLTAIPPRPVALERQASVGQWVLLHALTRPEAASVRALGSLGDVAERTNLGPAWDIRWIDGASLGETAAPDALSWPEEKRTAALPAQALELLGWEYPHLALAHIPSKVTATQLKGRALDQETAQEAVQTGAARAKGGLKRPDFVARQEGLTGAQRGIALHLAMQYLPLVPMTPEETERAVEQLVQDGYLTALQGEAVDARRLSAFLCSDLGREMAGADECRREFKFSVLTDAARYDPRGAGEQILLQGVIDAWFVRDGEITLVDFKSDRVTRASLPLRAEEYRGQLEAYAQALEEMLGKKVGRKVLWFFAQNQAFEL